MSAKKVHARILELCKRVTAQRPRTVINHILKHGSITTEELQSLYGYNHPPRAARDVRENGVPLETYRVTSKKTGRSIGAYRFADPHLIRKGRIGGRRAFAKGFRDKLVAKYGCRNLITGEFIDKRHLQIDHRIPYEVAGEMFHEKISEYMLIDAATQRSKSWACEQCTNWRITKDANICRSCFWAFPESHNHVAGDPIRRIIVEWRGHEEVSAFETLKKRAKRKNVSMATLLKKLSEK